MQHVRFDKERGAVNAKRRAAKKGKKVAVSKKGSKTKHKDILLPAAVGYGVYQSHKAIQEAKNRDEANSTIKKGMKRGAKTGAKVGAVLGAVGHGLLGHAFGKSIGVKGIGRKLALRGAISGGLYGAVTGAGIGSGRAASQYRKKNKES